MGASPFEPGLGLVTDRRGRGLTPAAVVEFATVELLGGRITVDGVLGRGTTFSVHLPAAA